ncbi:MAG: GGDEF domain-containing protein [Sphaerochaetaceae bacterium]|nr:GGDEF domain-containing protein [Sphaerochaetaceae bacterium]
MRDLIHAIYITEVTPLTSELEKLLTENLSNISCVHSMVEGLSAAKNRRYDAAIISNDMEDFYTVEKMIRILLEVGSFRYILVISEKETPVIENAKMKIQGLHMSSAQNALNSILRDLNEIKVTEDTAEITSNHLERMIATTADGISLFDSVPSGLYRIDPEGNFLDINRTLVNILRAPNPAVLRRENYFSLFKDPDQRTVWKEIIDRDKFIRGLIYEIEPYDGETIWVRDNVRSVYNEEKEVVYYDGSIENITYQKKLEDKLSFLVTQDILTGVPNRNFFHDQAKMTISQARYTDDIVAFLIVNVDRFTDINERYTHKVGDRLLQLIAGRIKEQVRKSDLVARLGGDKFIVLLNGLRNRRDVLAVAKKISLVFNEPFNIDDTAIHATVSIGISLYPEHSDEVNTLIRLAEIATFAVKERERGGYMIYSNIISTTYKYEE